MTSLDAFKAAIAFVKSELRYQRAIRDALRVKRDGSRALSPEDWRRLRDAQSESRTLEEAMYLALESDSPEPAGALLPAPLSAARDASALTSPD